MNKSEWFDGLRYAEFLAKNESYGTKELKTAFTHDIEGDVSDGFCSGFLDYIDHLENRLNLKETASVLSNNEGQNRRRR